MSEELFQDVTWNAAGVPTQQYTDFGMVWRPKVPGWLTALGWRRAVANKNPAIYLTLWEKIAGSQPLLQFTEADIQDDNNVGWQWTELPRPYVVQQGHAYIVAATGFGDPNDLYATGISFYQPGGVVNPSPTANLVADYPLSSFNPNRATAPPQYPTLFGTGQVHGVSVRFEPQDVAGGGIDSSLASYLTPAGSHYAGTALADVRTTVENLYNEVFSATNGLAKISGDTALLLNRWSEELAGKLNQASDDVATLLNRLSADLANALNLSSAAILDLIQDVLTCYGGAPGALLCLIRDLAGWFLNPPQVGDPRMQLIDTTTYNTALAWPVQADQYVLNVTTLPPLRSGEDTAGVDTRYRLGWWTVLNGDFAGQRQYIDFPHALLVTPNGARMPGLLLNTGPGSAGTVQAYQQVEA